MKTVIAIKQKGMHSAKAQKKANSLPAIISIKTEKGNFAAMRIISDEEIKNKRNPAYNYLA